MKRIIGWIMMLITLIAMGIMGAYFIGIAKILLMVLSSFLASAWIGVAIVLINSVDYKKGTDNEEEETKNDKRRSNRRNQTG